MLTSFKSKAQNFWTVGHERTLKLKKNIIYSFLIKGASVLVGFVVIPLTIHYINAGQYGIWLTISSMVSWINTFDIGLSNGLRNKMAHSLALNETENIARYISTTYAILFLIAAVTFLLFFLTGSFFDWNQMLNIKNAVNYDIWPIIILTLGAFCVQFFLQPVNSVLTASHQPFKASLIALFGQVLTLVVIYLLTVFTKGSLFLLVAGVSASPVIVFLIANFYFFNTSLKSYKPKFRYIDLSSARSLLNTGGIFFFIQVGAIVLFQTDNILISRNLGPQDVTVFNLAYKYFSLIQVIFVIILTPYWSAFTDAYAKKDMIWIRESIGKTRQQWLYISGLAVVLLAGSPLFYRAWIGNTVHIPFQLSLAMTVYVMTTTWQGIYSSALNGIGKLRIQLILVISTALLNIPLSIYLIARVGLYGTVLANIILVVIINIFLTYQVNLIMKEKEKGIWAK
ncbi:oligosaccharide flippase family protein [Mucilaginibacter sabulilitoris]|uniref:Oligosaccharide flippase family protein n=1 Tax=Mucilaginibacter sabulilitoris TaxID=1173583 RepID=A0ABZ0TSD2_9SPHI|nr:oligosaccharide flippase family protein [Mucilaginibacter sabulilitoris]WPU95676.1 oligosaccharide flippase family protein [Mucilaginibacter sabulilitoris]